MASDLAQRPLLKWDGFGLRIDLDMLEVTANRILAERAPMVELISLEGEGETLRAHLRVEWKGLPAQVHVCLSELRLYRRFFGCRLESLSGPFGLPVPISLIATLVRRFASELAHFGSEDQILLVDLRKYLPDGADLRIQRVSCLGRWLEIRLSPGALAASLTSRFVASAE
jgi:hypothetical protein